MGTSTSGCISYPMRSRVAIVGALLMLVVVHSELLTVCGLQQAFTVSSAVESACKSTLYPEACTSAFASISGSDPVKDAKQLFDISVQFAIGHVHSARSLAYNLTFPTHHGVPREYPPTGAYDCLELLDNTVELLSDVLDGSSRKSNHDVETWLSAALTNQVTCAESLASRPPADRELIEIQSERLRKFISNSLALHKRAVKGRSKGAGAFDWLGSRRRLLSAVGSDNGFPSWLSASDRRLLEASPSEIVPHAVVAKDGSGTHTSINDALAFVSLQQSGAGGGSGGRTVIYIKAGTYNEVIRVPTKQKNVMLMGDGKGVSVIAGSRSNNGGFTTYQSAIVAGMGAGFIAKDISIINNAGPAKEQAVALRVGADRAVIYRCSIQGYQDTLYAHSNRQFYSSNDIYGTVDFIFGNAAAVFQGCNISPRRPGGGQRNSVTAQGRRDPNQNTGFVIQGCRIVPAGNLGGVQSFLGRPWHQYSRVVIMQSYIDSCIHPSGWEPWSGGFALSTLYYGEYGNTGPGAGTGGRVRWPGVHASMSAAEASKFTVSNFIFGDAWLPGTGVSYKAGL